MTVLIDSGFLFASLNASEREHHETVKVLAGFREQIVFPVPAITEVTYLLARDISNEAAADFVGKLATGNLTLENPTSRDYERTSQLLVQYSDASVDFVDGLIVAMSERLKIIRILTLDRRDFQLIRPNHCKAFELLP